MNSKTIFLGCIALTFCLVAPAGAQYWTDENGAASNHSWANTENWDNKQLPGQYDIAQINYSRYGTSGGQGPIVDSNVGAMAHLKVGSAKSPEPAILTVVDGGLLRINKTGQWPPSNGHMLIAQGNGASGTVVMKGGKIIVEGMCQIGKRPGQGKLHMTGANAEFIVKGPLKLGGMDGGPGDAFVQLDAGTLNCYGLSMYRGESKIDITGGKLLAGPGRAKAHGYRNMVDFIKGNIENGSITAYNKKGKVQFKPDSPEKGWVEVWAVMEQPESDKEKTEAQKPKQP